MPSATPILYIVAGPNGSGKSTLTRSRRFGAVELIDPDAIARRTSVVDPESAVRAARRDRIYDNASPENPHREVAILTPESRWIAENPPPWLDTTALQPESSR